MSTTGPRHRRAYIELEGVAFALYLHRIMLLYRMRLGKTKIALDWATHLRQAKLWTRKGLVIAHAPVGLGVWEIEAQKHSNLKVVAVQKNVHEFIDALDSDTDLIVVPWSGLQAMFTIRGKTRPGADGKTQNKLYADRQGIRMAAQFFSLVVIDESHRCKNHLSLRFLIAEEIVKQCKFRMIMTGTPTGRNPYALWAQAFLADEGRALGYNYYMFQQAFGHEVKNWFKPNHKEWKFDHRMLPRLRHKLSNLALSCTHSDISPDQIKPDLVELKMSTAQRETYNEVVNRLVHLPKDNLIQIRATFVRLRQAASGFLPLDDGTLLDLPGNVKLDWIEGFFEDFPDDMKVVIFHEFIHSGELIVAAAKKAKIKCAWLTGQTKNQTGQVRLFQEGKVPLLVANTATGGMAIDLAVADYLIWYESPVDPLIRAQAEARPLSSARGNRVLWQDDLLCAPVERRILTILGEGRDVLKAIMDEPKALFAR